MKKILIILIAIFTCCNLVFAESYYFKECKLSEKALGDYLIDLEKNIINVTLKANDGKTQTYSDKIKLITKDRITSEIIPQKNKKFSTQYYLDANSKSIFRQLYKREDIIGLIKPEGPEKQSFCKNVKANWDKSKKKDDQISKAQKEILKKKSTLPKCEGNDLKQWVNCQGTYTAENGYKYIGQFKNGEIFEGVAEYPGKAKYVGLFKNNQPHGQGTFTYADGSNYFGEWKNGTNHGNGIKTWKDGKKYVGEFKNDQIHGQGTFTYPDGSKYVGEYKDGKRHGKGTLTYASGKTYVGQFVAGYEHGKGTCYNKDGSSTECEKDIAASKKNTHDISFVSKKWIKVSEYQTNSGKGKKIIDQLTNNFDQKANEICVLSKNYDVLEKKIQVVAEDETPAFGLETVVKIGIYGVVECK